MAGFHLHHVSLPVADLDRSLAFYQGVLDLPLIPRPNFSFGGAWLGLGDRQIHLIVVENDADLAAPETRSNPMTVLHIALATQDFDGLVGRLRAAGFDEGLAEDDPKYLRLFIGGPAGFDQAFVRDPDGHLLELNGATL